MERTAIILAGDNSGKFGCDKGLLYLANKPLIMHVADKVQNIVDEVIVCLKDDSKVTLYSQALPRWCRIIFDEKGFPECPLRGAYTGLLNARGSYSVILPCDTPFISAGIIDLLFNIATGVDAVIPRWPEGHIEPLQAVYRTETTLKAAKRALDSCDYSLRAMVVHLKSVRYISTLAIRDIDPKAYEFMSININTPVDLKRAEALAKRFP